jgi:hypothetical protein
MAHTLKNVSRCLVSLRGNSGETWHIPPNASIEVPDFEVSDNAMLHKLKGLRLLGVDISADANRHEHPDTKRRESDDDDEDRGKKTRAKR